MRLAVVSFALAVLVACADGAGPATPVGSVSVTPDAVFILPDSTVQLAAEVRDSAGAGIPGRTPDWRTLDPSVATVTAAGLVHGLVPGAARVVAAVDASADTAYVIVLVPADTMWIFPASDSVVTGDSLYYGAVLRDSLNRDISLRPVAWSVDDTTRATVRADWSAGVVRGVRPGITRVRAMVEGLRDSAVIKVLARVAQFAITPDTLDLHIGDTATLAAAVLDSAGGAISGRVIGWSVTGLGATVDSAGRVTSVAGGDARIAAMVGGLRDSTIVRSRTDGPVQLVATGDVHSCASSAAGSVYCWGLDEYGQLGSGAWHASSSARRTAPVPAPVAVSAGKELTCALTTTGEAWCWGINTWGQAGPATGNICIYGEPCRLAPARVGAGMTFVRLATGDYHVCGIAPDGAAWCWGGNLAGELGSGATDNQPHIQPLAVTGGHVFTEIAAGGEHTCGIEAGGTAWCWGYNPAGQLGTGSIGGQFDYTPAPVAVIGNHVFAQIAARDHSTCALDDAGAAWCWGEGYSATPTQIAGGLVFTSLAVGRTHRCGLAANGTAWCWGSNLFGQLGDGTTIDATAPVPVTGGHHFTALASGSYHTCGAATDGAAYCWGEGSQWELGSGGMLTTAVPQRAIGWP